ncbi:E3 ubiquitin-protein ligase TRIM71-like [Ptychodera flava]|uniref:E3 ubiquitin-protein ligase TRIM71-like n=1 Tax=Ptychodera flava TaxID=63121 RepID=UPI00396A1D33
MRESSEKDKGTLSCPTCSKLGRLPGGGLSKSKENVFFKVLSDIRKQRILRATMKLNNVMRAKIVRRTYVLPANFVSATTCLQPHEVIPQTKDHKVLKVAQYRREKRKNPADSKVYCKTHHGKEIHTYCDTCDDLVCQDCVVVNGCHTDHVFKDLKVAADEFIKQLKEMIEKLGGQKTEAKRGLRAVKENKKNLDIQSQVQKKNVECKGKEMAEAVELETKRLLAKVEEEYGKRLVTAKNELEEWRRKGERMSKACSDIETLIHHGNSAQLLSAREDAITHIEDLLNIDVTSENPEFIKFKPFDDHSQHDLLGWLTSGPEVSVSLCTVRLNHTHFWTGDSAKVVVTTKDSEGNPIIASEDVVAKVQKQDESPWEDVPVTDNRDGTHTVTVHCQVAGNISSPSKLVATHYLDHLLPYLSKQADENNRS